MAREQRVVDNRVFLLGLDELYREAMKKQEERSLLICAQEISKVLSVAPANIPVEGYYYESKELTEYFLLMRSLQQVSRDREVEVADNKSFLRLRQVAESPLFGLPYASEYLLASGKDPLSVALAQTSLSNWTIDSLTDAAHTLASNSKDISLVALASLARDSVVLAALRESVVLYALDLAGCVLKPSEPEYVWMVDEQLQIRASQFVETFNDLFDESLPIPRAENASQFWDACDESKVIGRCVRIGFDDSVHPNNQYHWAINCESTELVVHDFWDTEIWTTERYLKEQLRH